MQAPAAALPAGAEPPIGHSPVRLSKPMKFWDMCAAALLQCQQCRLVCKACTARSARRVF